jgi:uncharacterized membrane protein (UPF0127 family)
VTRSLGAVVIAAALLIGPVGCAASSATETVTLGGEAWTVLDGGGDGMRGRVDFGGADAMLFRFDPEVDTRSIVWVMDGVAFPLDIAWFDDDGALVGTATMAVCPAKPCPTYAADGLYRSALEAPVGAFDDLVPTDRLVIDD